MLPLAAALVACTPTSSVSPAHAPAMNLASPDARAAATTVDAFAADLHAALPKSGNLFYSPASIAIALGIADQGAAGSTKAEMDKVLHLSGPVAYASLESALASSASPEIGIADRLYFERSLAIDPAFAALAPNETVDFKNDSDGARKKIDAWVSDRTHAKIPELIGPGVLTGDARFVIVNAVYFKGEWAQRFDAGATRDDVFHADVDENAPTMHATLSAGYGAHGGAHVLDLPYKSAHGPELSMTIVLPDARAGLADVEATYEKEGIAPFVAATSETEDVEVSIPKMKMTSSLELGDALKAMGMRKAFEDDAELGGITRTEPVKISKVIHQAFAVVNEEGTEAAAATGVVGVKATAVMMQTEFRADHPFLFFVRDRASGLVLFAGRCAKPV
ncbi:MAG TPA: serpin family protein [Polyangiaceae bacterium]|jgi:serpin B